MANLYVLNEEHCPSHWTFSLKALLTFGSLLLLGSIDLELWPELDGESSGGPPVLLDLPESTHLTDFIDPLGLWLPWLGSICCVLFQFELKAP